MLTLAFFSWWYSKGWSESTKKSLDLISSTAELFSIKLLLITLFQPWRRIYTPSGIGFSAHVQAVIDNAISRLVGFAVRIIVLFFALVTTLLLALATIVQIIIWPLLPPAVIVTIILGFK